jgi:RHS repeat-associated protein
MVQDRQGSVTDILDDSGSVIDHIFYDGYGNETESTPTEHANGYAGYFRDTATGLLHTDTRWYGPAIGRWISEDPIGFGGGDTNLSRYVGNGPTNGVDPAGQATLRFSPESTRNMRWTEEKLKPGNLGTTKVDFHISWQTVCVCNCGRVWYHPEFTVTVIAKIFLDINQIRDLKRKKLIPGLDYRTAYGHEQKHVESTRWYAASVTDRLTEAEQKYSFSSRAASDRYGAQLRLFYTADFLKYFLEEMLHEHPKFPGRAPGKIEMVEPIDGLMPDEPIEFEPFNPFK